ncbi:bifunctional methyltransferase/pyrophosphohydrolase YabN [Alkalibacillus aidingensis]|uniref:nucleoside triphosphate pyrophosphohydrolase n=1 Tax=Alkalibacillus aidingensis TaxID=2747607 RepID=UPI001661612C|nr:nucleoside triphosphate pyrophosphohydrolase [Alkalibacillus aidingensis]
MGQIKVIGLGASSIDQIPLGVYRQLVNHHEIIYTRTKKHPVIESLKQEGVRFQSFDHFYEELDDFGQVYESIANELIQRAKEQNLVYTVPGHPMVAERTVQLLLDSNLQDVSVEISSGQSFLDALFTATQVDPIEGFQLLDGTALDRSTIQYENHLFIGQVYDDFIASEVKLTLMEDLPFDYKVKIIHAAGSPNESVKTVPLHELDHDFSFSNLTTLYVPPQTRKNLHHTFSALREVIATLRGPNGCPWDRKQTHTTLRPYLIEEAYEVIEAIEEDDDAHLAEELGDVLLQIMLHSQIAEESGYFTVDDVIKSITDKMVERHPHVFGDVTVESSDEVSANWEQIKQKNKPKKDSVLEGLNDSLPRLLYAKEIQKKVAKVGFDWKTEAPVFEKVKEELEEFQEAVSKQSIDEMELEFGDLLFSLVNTARFYKIDPELALDRTCRKFISRFKQVEQLVKQQGLSLEEMHLEEMDRYWEQAKKQLTKGSE